MLVKDECSSWYNRVGDFYFSFEIGKGKFYTAMDQQTQPNRTTPLQSAMTNCTILKGKDPFQQTRCLLQSQLLANEGEVKLSTSGNQTTYVSM